MQDRHFCAGFEAYQLELERLAPASQLSGSDVCAYFVDSVSFILPRASSMISVPASTLTGSDIPLCLLSLPLQDICMDYKVAACDIASVPVLAFAVATLCRCPFV